MLNIARIHAVLCQRIHQDGAVFTDYAGVIHRAARFGDGDGLVEPFSTGELLARIRALTRRKGEVEVDCLHFAELQLNRQTYDLIQGENRMKLSLKEYQIMEMLLSNPEQIIPKERFIEKIWGYESDVEYNNIEVYISFLRKKLTAIHSTVQIRTARGIGYFLEKKA